MELSIITKISPNPSLEKSGKIKEAELLFLLSRVDPGMLAFEKAQALIPELNWDAFTSLAVKHGVAALVYKNLLKLKDIPQNILARFQGIYNNCLRSNILMVSEIDRLTAALSQKNIEIIPLKGPLASEKIFGDVGLYPSSDIDILVHGEDISRVREFLESEGYQLHDKDFDKYREFFLKELYHISLSNGKFTIEPHWNLFMRYFTTPPGFWWEESIIVSSNGKEYRFLSPEKNILYASFRFFYKGFTPLRFLVFLAGMIHHYKNEINWVKLFDYARRYSFESVLRVSMKLTHDLLNASLPESYTHIQGLRVKLLYAVISRMILKAEDIPPLKKFILSFLRDDLKGLFTIFLRRIFPPMGEIVSRYRVKPGTGKALTYYLINPMLILLKKHRG